MSRSRSRSPSRSPPPRPRGRARSRSRSRSRDRADAVNPGNTLYVTGLASRVTERDLEDHFSKEGKVVDVHLVVEPRTRISRGFSFVTMDTVEDADRCIKYLNQSVLEGRYITVEKKTNTIVSYVGSAIVATCNRGERSPAHPLLETTSEQRTIATHAFGMMLGGTVEAMVVKTMEAIGVRQGALPSVVAVIIHHEGRRTGEADRGESAPGLCLILLTVALTEAMDAGPAVMPDRKIDRT